MSEPIWCEIRQHYCRCGDYGPRCDDDLDAAYEREILVMKAMRGEFKIDGPEPE